MQLHLQQTNKPLISVVTVCFNAAEFIEQCITSVLRQDFINFEYVIIDGGSEDGTVAIIERYADRLAYWHSKKDRGLAHAFNLGVEHAKGDWLIFLNADDFFCNDEVLRKASIYLDQNKNADAVFGQIVLVDRDDVESLVSGPHGHTFSLNEFRIKDTIPHQATFTSRALFARIGGFDERYRIAVDYEHMLRAGRSFKAVHVPLVVATMRTGGMSGVYLNKALFEWRKAQLETKALGLIAAHSIYWLRRVKITLKTLIGT